MKFKHEPKVQMVPLDKITVVNKRSRGKDKHQQIIDNIATIGLKKPPNVARRVDKDGNVHYDLGCGQGRVEAFTALGQTEMPVLVIDTDREGLMLMSLAENLARRNRTTLEMAREIMGMKERGDKASDIARKTGLSVGYVNCILRLMRDGEERLVVAVERGTIPMSVAVAIADSDDAEVQRAMSEAYEKGQLKGKSLFRARRLVEQRRIRGKGARSGVGKKSPVTADTLLVAYKKDSARQQMLLNRFKVTDARLQFISSALKKLLSVESFVNLLLAEKLGTLPQYLASRIQMPEVNHG